jgi:hypothetical protein
MESFNVSDWINDVQKHNLSDYELNNMDDIRTMLDDEVYNATTWNFDCMAIIQGLNYMEFNGRQHTCIRDVAQAALNDWLYENGIAERIHAKLCLID